MTAVIVTAEACQQQPLQHRDQLLAPRHTNIAGFCAHPPPCGLEKCALPGGVSVTLGAVPRMLGSWMLW